MASERTIRALVGQAAILTAGGAATWAGVHGLYASALTATLAGALLAFAHVESAPLRVGRSIRAPPSGSLETPLLRALLNAAPAPLVLLDAGGMVRAVNRAARLLFDTDDHVSRPTPELLRALREDAAGGRSRLALAGARGGPVRLYTLSLADVGVSEIPLRLGALLDVQAEVHAAEAETLRRVLQVLSHELMNSLTPVTSLAETAADLLSGEPSPAAVDAAREAIGVIGRRAEGLAEFVAGYGAAARLPEPRPCAIDVAELAQDIVRLIRARPDAGGVEITLRRPIEPLVRVTDPDLVAQALTNLLVNAVEAAATMPEAAVGLTVVPLPQGARLEVRDSGSGVSAAEVQNIFLPLTTSKTSGSGVGLHLARSAMRSLGGDVTLVDRGESGSETCFTLTI